MNRITTTILIITAALLVLSWTYRSFEVEGTRNKKVIKITAYSEYDSCHYPGCPMASGKKAYVGAIACPREWPLGIKVVVEGREYICEDRYNEDLDERIDIFQGYGRLAHERAKEFGVKELTVVIK